MNERFQRLDGAASSALASHEKLALYHYVLKSKEVRVDILICLFASSEYTLPQMCLHLALCCVQDFGRKISRGDGMGQGKNLKFFEDMNALATQNCTDAVRLGPFV